MAKPEDNSRDRVAERLSPASAHLLDDVSANEPEWREALIRPLGLLTAVLIGGVGTVLAASFPITAMQNLGVGMIAASGLLFATLFSSRIPASFKAWVIVITMCVASVVAYLSASFLPGSALAVTVALVYSALLLGQRAFVAVFLAAVLFLGALTAGVATGFWIAPGIEGLDPSSASNWARTSAVSVITWTAIGFSINFVINTIERNSARRRQAVRSLRAEIAERQAAEAARREAEFMATNAQKMEAVGQLAASIAHDFNNALLVIRGWNELRGLGDDDDRQREATRAIEQATEHSAQLGRQLLTFARKDVRAPKYLSLGKLVDDMRVSLQNLVGPKITVTIETAHDTMVFADESQLQQLIYNLVINARDAIDEAGHVRIMIDAAGRDDADRWALLSVEDDGPGIPTELMRKVFEPFFTTKDVGKGTGLGLATVASIARQSGGNIDVVSQPGKTVFTLRLPAAASVEEFPVESRTHRLPRELGLRILVLEDDPQARKIIAAALIRNGNEVVESDRGDTTLALLAKDRKPFDLLCSDAVFPGDPLADVLAAFERHSPEGKILICSGYVPEELALSKLESGEYAFLPKPFDGSRLLSTIREMVGGTQS
ncbi:MAG: ATP-binding protein [Pseudomonadota bacterium]